MKRRQDVNATPIRGDVRIGLAKNTPMERPSLAASVQAEGRLQPELPPLYDVQVHSLIGDSLVITGTEITDGVAYAQSWHCRVVSLQRLYSDRWMGCTRVHPYSEFK
ncbi:hypothetical protein D9M69_729390 [compost metagenome]